MANNVARSFDKSTSLLNEIYDCIDEWQSDDNIRKQQGVLDKMYRTKQKLLDELDEIMPLKMNINLNALSPRKNKTFRVGYATSPNTKNRLARNASRKRLRNIMGESGKTPKRRKITNYFK